MAEKTLSLHAVALAVGEFGILIRGASGAGKSTLAAQMISTWRNPAVCLVADDRVILEAKGGRIVARPHPAIAGQIELYGLGLATYPVLDAVVIRLIIDLVAQKPVRMPDPAQLEDYLLGQRLPCIVLQAHADPVGNLRAFWSHIRNDLMSF